MLRLTAVAKGFQKIKPCRVSRFNQDFCRNQLLGHEQAFRYVKTSASMRQDVCLTSENLFGTKSYESGADDLAVEAMEKSRNFLRKLCALSATGRWVEMNKLLTEHKTSEDIQLTNKHYLEVIKATGQAKQYNLALSLFLNALESGIKFDLDEVKKAIHFASTEKKLDIMLELKKYIKKEFSNVDANIYNIILDTMMELNHFDAAIQTFEEMRREQQPPTFVYATYIRALSKLGKIKECKDTVLEMRNCGVPISHSVHKVYIAALAKDDLEEAEEAFERACEESSSQATSLLYIQFMSLCNECNDLGKALRTLNTAKSLGVEMSQEFIAVTISTLTKLGSIKEAAEFMLEHAERLDSKIAMEVLRMCSKEKHYDFAKQIVQQLEKQKHYREVLRKSILDIMIDSFQLKNLKHTNQLMQVFEFILEDSIESAEWHNEVIQLYCKIGMLDKASLKYKFMKKKGLDVSLDAYFHIFSLCEKKLDCKTAVDVLRDMIVRKIRPNSQICRVLVRFFAKKPEFHESISELFEELKNCDVPVAQRYHVLAIDVFGSTENLEKAIQFYNEIERRSGALPKKSIVFALCSHLVDANRLDEAFELLQKLDDEEKLDPAFKVVLMSAKEDSQNKKAINRIKYEISKRDSKKKYIHTAPRNE